MAFLKNRFGPPDISRLKAEQDAGGLIDALTFRRDPAVRQEAALALGELRVSFATEALIVALREDQDGLVRRAAAIALGRIRPSSAFLPAMSALHDSDAGARQAAVFLLGQLGNQKATPFLLPFLFYFTKFIFSGQRLHSTKFSYCFSFRKTKIQLNNIIP